MNFLKRVKIKKETFFNTGSWWKDDFSLVFTELP